MRFARTRGFTIAEVLAALLVMAIGIIGIAALYSDGAQGGRKSEPHAQAEKLAETMAERIRANQAGRIGYLGTIGVLCDRFVKSPTAIDAAAQEAACWEDEVERTLPSGLGTITRDTSATPPTFVVAVSWSAPETGAASYVMRIPFAPYKVP